MKESTNRRNRRERPACRSAPERTEPLPIIPENVPPYVIPTGAQAEWRNLLKLQALPYAGYLCYLGRFLHSADATVGMTYVFSLVVTNSNIQRVALRPWRQIAAATLRGSIHPHGFYSLRPRNGTQAVPYGFADTSFSQPP